MEADLRSNPNLRQFLLSNVTLTGTRIGAGAYGIVEEVKISGTICAAKRLHDMDVSQDEIRRASTQFVKECQLMSTLRHPNIVQFLGVCFFPGSQLPALIMERLQIDLHNLLDPAKDTQSPPSAPKPFFPLSLKCSILHNVASGLAYLHERTPPIIHRDLSARNVLLTSGMVAKIADLGVARIVPPMRAAATMTTAPGTAIYMPPEATKVDSKDHTKYDVSIDIFSFGVVAIFTLSQTFPCKLLDATYRNEQKQIMGRSELERRVKYMQMIYSQLREDHPLLKMIERCLDFPEDRPNIREVLGLLEEARGEERDDEMEMNKLELLQALKTQPRNQPSPEKHSPRARPIHSTREKLTVQCSKKKKAPREMSRGSVTTDDQFAYFTPLGSKSVHRYQWNTEKWYQKELPPAPYCNSGLVIIDGELTAVGGQDGSHYTNKLFTLRQGRWVEHYPPMNTARFSPAVVSTSDGNYIVVIGGSVDRWTATVELFHVRSRRWYELTNLPQDLTLPSATICDNLLYVIGGDDNDGFCCSLQPVLSSDQPISPQAITWKLLPHLPVTASTAATLSECLVIIGGDRSEDDADVNTIHQLVGMKWEKIGSMTVTRSECFVVSSSPDELLIVGGVEEKGVEKCSVVKEEAEKNREVAQAQQQLRQKETEVVQTKDKELAQAQQQLRQLRHRLQSSEALVADFQKTLQQRDSELETLRPKTQSPVLPPPHTRKLHTSSTSQSTQQYISEYPDSTHHCYGDMFPGVSFLGEPLEYVLSSKQVTISPPNLGVTLDIPSDAVPPGEHVTVTIQPCFSGAFIYPEGYEPLSAVYHISTNTALKKKGQLTLEHFGNLQTKEQTDNMYFFTAKSPPVTVDGGKVYQFGMVKGGEFRMGENYGAISLEHFCLVSIGIYEQVMPSVSVPASNSDRCLSSVPSLPNFLDFKTSSGSSISIAEQIGTLHENFGILLLEDHTSAITTAIATQHQNNAVAINLDILTRWIQGQGKKPVTWSTLIGVLKDIGLRVLAQTFQEGL